MKFLSHKIRVTAPAFEWGHFSVTKTLALVVSCILLISCSEIETPKTEEFYSESKPPRKQEFRWSNGKAPKTFDPAFVSAPPETDIVRAIYDGLTETDSKTLEALPAIATDWSSDDDYKIWTFKLRKDAKWSNGKPVLAEDFVRSWKRLADLGEKVPNHELLKNFVGVVRKPTNDAAAKKDPDAFSKPDLNKVDSEAVTNETLRSKEPGNESNFQAPGSDKDTSKPTSKSVSEKGKPLEKVLGNNQERRKPESFGVVAVDDHTLRISLTQSDKELPKLVAHPVFRAVYASGDEFEDSKLKTGIVTSGAFRLVSADTEKGVSLEKADNYWNKEKIKLERVTFVPAKDADSALKAYRDGEVDAVTNVDFEPLALKLLTPYIDFKRTTHSALNFYEFNRQKPPFNDRRVRKALAISIERERLTEDKMDGATTPAYNFLPFKEPQKNSKLTKNATEARELLEKAGFPNGENFPSVKLVVNRNNVQKRIARSVAEMWKKELNVETEIVVKEKDELESAKALKEYDVMRRGIVFPTADETANMLSIFKPMDESNEVENSEKSESRKSGKLNIPMYGNSNSDSNSNVNENSGEAEDLIVELGEPKFILTEEEAIEEVPAIPLYFPTSYSLVKPYVRGFEMNVLDAPSLKEVGIDSDWQPKTLKKES